MLLQLDDNFRVTIDSSRQNIQLEQLQNVTDKKTKEVVRREYVNIGFHGLSLRSVLIQYRNAALVTDDKFESINDVLDRLNEIEKIINKVAKQTTITIEMKQND